MRVLIVDDEALYRVYLTGKLSGEGHDVAVASGAASCYCEHSERP